MITKKKKKTYLSITVHNTGRPEHERLVLRNDFSVEEFEDCEFSRADETESTWYRLEYPAVTFWYGQN